MCGPALGPAALVAAAVDPAERDLVKLGLGGRGEVLAGPGARVPKG
jgi:hypothetical protein